MTFLTNQNVLLTLLLFTVAIFVAQDLVIVDEEVLVLLCFVLFLFLLYQTTSHMISSELHSRAMKIRDEFEENHLLQEDVYLTVLHYHGKQLSLQNEIQDLFVWTKEQIKELIQTRSQALTNSLLKETEEKCKWIIMKEQNFLQSMQEETSSYLTSKVISNSAELDALTILEGIEMIENLATFSASQEDDFLEEQEEYDDFDDDDDYYDDDEEDEDDNLDLEEKSQY
uniref:ATP synthase F0 subunit b n=1 Tax=Jakoba libera TaxID=143017 RepID=Q85IH9_JAKLI|nr:ATP synthase F0 subunit b [Jakoba libera]AAO45015.1 ATP synthase F0 subunit b [Jakoba libera]AGH24182.1 ATP synthase F0 subunit b [Jakoba libera]